jgi:hypothetical protein
VKQLLGVEAVEQGVGEEEPDEGPGRRAADRVDRRLLF